MPARAGSLFCVSVPRGVGARLGATNPGPSRRGRRHDRSRLRRIHRAGAERLRAVNATAPSTPARVRVARARVLLSRPVCCLRLLASARARFLRTLGPHHTEPSFTQRRPPSSCRPAVHALPTPKSTQNARRVFCGPAGLRPKLHARASISSWQLSETHKRPATSAADARAGNKAQWAKRRRAYARKSCPWPRNKQRP